jgi:hypothetical protein
MVVVILGIELRTSHSQGILIFIFLKASENNLIIFIHPIH